MSAMKAVYEALGGPWSLAAQVEDIPTRLRVIDGECSHHEPDPDTSDGIPCDFAGEVTVALFDDTEEAIWVCPSGHENSERWVDFA